MSSSNFLSRISLKLLKIPLTHFDQLLHLEVHGGVSVVPSIHSLNRLLHL